MVRTSRPVGRAAVALVCASLVLAGCSHKGSKRNASGASGSSTTAVQTATTTSLVPATTVPVTAVGQTIRLGEADKGRTVPAHPGDVIVVSLDNCFSCGYHWEITLATDGNVVAHRSTDDQQAKNPQGQVGGSGTRAFTFQAVRAGSTRLELGYFPPAKGAQAESTYNLAFAVA